MNSKENLYSLSQEDLEYFQRGKTENLKFFSRLQYKPDFDGLKVLDVGCGHGALAVYAAERGARKVVGIDINERRIVFAKRNLLQNYPNFEEIVNFRCEYINEIDVFDFDIILSKDSFEHIIGLNACLDEMIKRLINNGKILIGFAPLYRSPFGDHGRTLSVLPWLHLLRTEKNIIKRINKQNAMSLSCIYDLGLNMLALKEYQEILYGCGLKVEYFNVNVSTKFIMKIFRLISKIPFLREYFTHNLYCILKKECSCVSQVVGR